MTGIAHISAADTKLAEVLLSLDVDKVQRQRVVEFIDVGLPSPHAENWRWSDLHRAVDKGLDDFPATAGQKTSVELSGISPDKTTFNSSHTDPITMLAGALAADTARRSYSIEQNHSEPLVLRAIKQNQLCASHVQIKIKSGCQVIILEEVADSGQSLAVDVREFVLDPGAHLYRILICNKGLKQARVQQSFVKIAQDGHYSQFILDFGAELSRIETHLSYGGENAKATLNGAYLLTDTARADVTSVIHHPHLDCITRQLHKGIVLDHGQAVFQGKFHVPASGQQTDAKMGHHTLLLSDHGRVRAKPELEIYADDVLCAHGNTTGTLDEDALFYMRQRGLCEADARALLMRAFVAQTLEDLPQVMQEQVGDKIDTWLEQAL